MSSEDEDRNLTVAQAQTTAASVASPAVASSSQPLGLALSLGTTPQGSTSQGSTPLGLDLSVGLPGSTLLVALSQTAAASAASPAIASTSKPLGLDLCLDSTPLGSDLSLGLPSSTLQEAQAQTTAASVASPAVASSSRLLGLDFCLDSTPLGSDLSLGLPSSTLQEAQAQTTAASVASTAVASSSRGPRALNFPFTKITIGDWTQDTASSGDLMAKCFFGKRQLVWELLFEVQREVKTKKLFKKMEIQWASISSLKASKGKLEVELREPPKFFIENDDPLADTKWIPIEYFTQNHPSSIHRRHELHFDPKVLETNINKIVTSDIFWSTLAPYPSLAESTFFVAGAGDQDASRKRKEREE